MPSEITMPPDASRPKIDLPILFRWSIRDSLLLSLALGCGFVLAALTAQAAQGKYLMVDATVRTALAAWQHPFLTPAMRKVTDLGGWSWLVLLIGVVLLVVWATFGPRVTLLWSSYTLMSALIFHGIRLAVARPRPLTSAYGFPSGHTVAALAFYGLLIYLLWPRLRPFRVCRAVIGGGVLLIIIGVGFSRLYLEKHWFSDVLGAYLAGGLYLTTSIWFLEQQRSRQRKLITYPDNRTA